MRFISVKSHKKIFHRDESHEVGVMALKKGEKLTLRHQVPDPGLRAGCSSLGLSSTEFVQNVEKDPSKLIVDLFHSPIYNRAHCKKNGVMCPHSKKNGS